MFNRFLIFFYALTICAPVLSSILVPPSMVEVVNQAQHIGIVRITSAGIYEPTDIEGKIPCRKIYIGEWEENYTNDAGSIEFASHESFELGARMLVYLSSHEMPRKMMSTNSYSELRYKEREARLENCVKTRDLVFTMPGTSSKFIDEEHVAEVLKTGVWLEYLQFFGRDLETISIFPASYSIDGEIISREQFIKEFYDDYKHQVLRTAGGALRGFRAIDWKEYREKLIGLIEVRHNRVAGGL